MNARDKLLKRKPKPLEIDGETIYVRSLTIAEFLHVEGMQKDESRQSEFVGYLISRAVTDEDGTPIFATETDPAINDLPLDLVARLTTEITQLSKTGRFTATVKNFDATP